MDYRKEIDGLRAIAVVPVIFFHGGFTLVSGGYVGVDVFFVISGYVTSRVHREAVVELAWAIPGVTSVEDHLVIDPFVTPRIPVAKGVA